MCSWIFTCQTIVVCRCQVFLAQILILMMMNLAPVGKLQLRSLLSSCSTTKVCTAQLYANRREYSALCLLVQDHSLTAGNWSHDPCKNKIVLAHLSLLTSKTLPSTKVPRVHTRGGSMDITGAHHPTRCGQECLRYNPSACRDGSACMQRERCLLCGGRS